jgi:hypothetical protein
MDLFHDPTSKVVTHVIYSKVCYRIKFTRQLIWEINVDQHVFVSLLQNRAEINYLSIFDPIF